MACVRLVKTSEEEREVAIACVRLVKTSEEEGRSLRWPVKVLRWPAMELRLRRRQIRDQIRLSLASISRFFNEFESKAQNRASKEESATYSGGMNGYIACCAEDPCPPIFRSPISGMEDIMDNQVICAIYRLPDAHKHITRPPAGVIFPKKALSYVLL
ncbi:unnamed protein product [Camellia sinensis]